MKKRERNILTDYMLDETDSLKKLLGGLFRVGSVVLFYVYLGTEWIEETDKEITAYFSGGEKSDLANTAGNAFAAALSLFLLYWFVIGIYRIYTFNMYLGTFEAELTPLQKKYMSDIDPKFSNFTNIESALRYRDSRMNCMAPDKAADFYMQTNRILGSTSRNSSVVGYINSKMSIMTPDQKINFLSGKK